jgi:cyclic pyranopterin phosphate synthase
MSTPPIQPGPNGRGGGSLTHIDDHGRARMVDVTAKPLTHRVALARCVVLTRADASQVLRDLPDGLDAAQGARFAGIQAAKQTSSLIPLCHPIHVDRVAVDVVVDVHRIEISAVTEIVERTGVEMEALTACAFTALTLVKALIHEDPETSIEELTLWHKSGGRSGDWRRSGPQSRLTRQVEPGSTKAVAESIAEVAGTEASDTAGA